jgi:hypothetical protein
MSREFGNLVNYPGFNYAGGFPQNVVGRITPEQAAMMAGMDIKQVLDDTLYDTKYFVAGTAVSSADIAFFSVPLNNQDAVANSAAVTFSKTPMNTNMTQAGQLERGQLFLIESIQIMVSVPGNFDLTVQSTGNTTLPATLPTSAVATNATAGVLSANLAAAILKAGVGKLKVGSNFFENGPLIQFPSEFGVSTNGTSAFSGTATAAVTTVPSDVTSNNGFGFCRYLRFPRIIEAGQNFQWTVNFFNLFTPSRNFEIQTILKGFRFRDVS